MNNMLTFLIGSLPQIVTRGNNRRINKDKVEDEFIKNYIFLINKLLMSISSDIKMLYIGGYLDEENGVKTNENINTAKLYFNALNYFFKYYGLPEIKKENFTILDKKSYLNDKGKMLKKINEANFVFFGIGQDKIFGELIKFLEDDNVFLNEIFKKNNTLLASCCAGSVMTAANIYGGKYDLFFHNRKVFEYPKNYPSLAINQVTMEPNLFSNTNDNTINEKFKNEFLIPDSYNKIFFGCKDDSYFLQGDSKIIAVGEIYLFINGNIYLICEKNKKTDITILNKLVNEQNDGIDNMVNILNAINQLQYFDLDYDLESQIIEKFKKENEILFEKKENRRKLLFTLLENDFNLLLQKQIKIGKLDVEKMNQDFITSLNLKNLDNELYDKYILLMIIKKYCCLYLNDFDDYLFDIYKFMVNYITKDEKIVLYFIECFSSFYENSKSKKLLKMLQTQIDIKVSTLNANNEYRKKLWSC